MQSVVLAVLVCAVAAQYYQQNQVPTPNQNQVQPTRFSQYNTQYGNQQQYGQQQYGQPSYTSSGYNSNMNSQYGTTAGYNTNSRMYDTQTQRYYNGVSTSSAVMAFTAAAVALVL